jgi:hypothetical protein
MMRWNIAAACDALDIVGHGSQPLYDAGAARSLTGGSVP